MSQVLHNYSRGDSTTIGLMWGSLLKIDYYRNIFNIRKIIHIKKT